MKNLIEVTNVVKYYEGRTVLNDVDLNLPKGSIMGLLGKNGAGKSTLIKCILGLIKPDLGNVQILGESAWTLSAEKKALLGYVPQIVQLYPWMKVRQVIAYITCYYPRWNSDLVQRLIHEWELRPEAKVQTLSPGELQKLGIIVALAHEPELLVLDEPVGALDPEARRKFLKTILDLAASKSQTVLLSTHITSDLERIADRVAILKQGKIIYSDGLDVLKDQVKRIHIATTEPLPKGLTIEGVLSSQVGPVTTTLNVKNFTSELQSQIQKQWSPSVEVQNLNLEDIFLELHK